MKNIVTAGLDQYNQLGVNPNNLDKDGDYTIIHPPQKLLDELQYANFDSTIHQTF